MKIEEPREVDIMSLDWSSMHEGEKRYILELHTALVSLLRRGVASSSAYSTNFRSLLLMMFIVFFSILQKFENKSIVMSILGFQILKTLVSKLVEASIDFHIEDARQALIEATVHRKKDKNA